MAMKKLVDGESDQHQAEGLGLVDSAERRVEDKGKPTTFIDKATGVCVVDGCFELKAPGQTHVCINHIRTN